MYLHNIILYLNKLTINLSSYNTNDVINPYSLLTTHDNDKKIKLAEIEEKNIDIQYSSIINDHDYNINFNKLLIYLILIISISSFIYILIPDYINNISIITLIIIILFISYYYYIIISPVRSQIYKNYWNNNNNNNRK